MSAGLSSLKIYIKQLNVFQHLNDIVGEVILNAYVPIVLLVN